MLPSAEQVVSYACSGGTLVRHSRNITARVAGSPQPATCAAMTAGATHSTLANNVTCSIVYNSNLGIVSISLTASQSGEAVNLYHQVHVDNPP